MCNNIEEPEKTETHVVEECSVCARISIEGHSAEYMAEQMRSHATWLMEHNMTGVAMQFKDAAAMLEHLANDRKVVTERLERIEALIEQALKGRPELEFIIQRQSQQIDAMEDPVERGANAVARSLAVTLTRHMEEGGEIEDELMLQICGTLSEHIELRKGEGEAAEDIRELWDLCFERTLHLLDDKDKQMLREKGLLE